MTPLKLRRRAVRQLVHLIIDGPAGYRTARELEAYCAGLGHVQAVQGDSRIAYVTRVTEQVQGLGQLERLLVQVAQAAPSAAVREQLQTALSEILSTYGQHLEGTPETGVFQVRPRAPRGAPPTHQMLSAPRFRQDHLSPEEVALLEDRWLEAVATHQAGARRLTILALSAILEHVLVSRAQWRPGEARASPLAPAPHLPIRDWTFDTLLAVASERHWISARRADFPYRVRQYRVYLSPARELQEGPLLDDDLNHEVWSQVRQALDDLSRPAS